MVTVSHIVKKLVSDKPFLEEALRAKIISYGNLAERFQPIIERELNKEIKFSAIIMALRRYSDELSDKLTTTPDFKFEGELIMKTNITDFTVIKTPELIKKLNSTHKLVNFERGDTLNFIIGNNEVSIIINEKHEGKLINFLKDEKVLYKEKGLVALSIIFTSKDFINTPGVIFTVIRKMAWDNINIYEIVSTMTELTFILNKKDSMKAYNSLYELVHKED
tara:strand:- start:1634 stop:2296 length:663 start_codon:yes stop_codon:yes gene_type:complete